MGAGPYNSWVDNSMEGLWNFLKIYNGYAFSGSEVNARFKKDYQCSGVHPCTWCLSHFGFKCMYDLYGSVFIVDWDFDTDNT